mgnify:CR=1 FL=1
MTREPKAATSWLYIGRGLYLATLLLVLSPTPSLEGASPTKGRYWHALRVLLRFGLLGLSYHPALETALARTTAFRLHRGRHDRRDRGRTGLPIDCRRRAAAEFLTVDLLLSALVLPIIDLAWSEAYAQLPMRTVISRTAGSLALAVAVLALVQVLPPAWSSRP